MLYILVALRTWLLAGKTLVGCCVYSVKIGPDGRVDHLKVRLDAKGYTQVYGSN